MKEMLSEYLPVYGVCKFEELKDHLIDCRNKEKIPNNAKSVIVAAFPYKLNDEKYAGRNISRYAVVKDYHTVVPKYLEQVTTLLKQKYPEDDFVFFSDNSPIPEVKAACLSGVGVIGRNGLLITKDYGSYVFLGEIITTKSIKSSETINDICLDCGKCIKACPAGAISLNGIDRTICLSAVTQKKTELSDNEKKMIKESGIAWGCDICQEVCPMNIDIKETEITEFLNNYTVVMKADDDLEGKAYGWRGKKVIERNLELL